VCESARYNQSLLVRWALPPTVVYRHCQTGSLAGAAQTLNDNEFVQRLSQMERKSIVEYMDKRQLNVDFQ